MNILKLFDSKDKKEQLTPAEQRRRDSLMNNLTNERDLTPYEKQRISKEILEKLNNTYTDVRWSQKDINNLSETYGRENTRTICSAIKDIYGSLILPKDIIVYFNNLSQAQINLLKNKELTENIGYLVYKHHKKTGMILRVHQVMNEGNNLRNKYNTQEFGPKREEERKASQQAEQEKIQTQKKAEAKKAKEKQEATEQAQRGKQEILDTLAESRKSYEQADPKTQETMVNTRREKFNRGLNLFNYPGDAFNEDNIRQIISTYGADNMQKLLDIVNIVYVQAMPHIRGTRKTDALMDQILSQQELNSIDNEKMKIFNKITVKSNNIHSLKNLVKDCETLQKTLDIR